ncbi:MAG: DUF5658 family protein [Chloroflexi bacterium]|nr:DUF5658 family protein [Chloroflexota bacterium]
MLLRYWIALNASDAILTAIALALGAAEANPFLQLLASHMGYTGMLFVKAMFAVAVGGILWERRKAHLLWGLNLLLTVIVLYNMLVMTYAI